MLNVNKGDAHLNLLIQIFNPIILWFWWNEWFCNEAKWRWDESKSILRFKEMLVELLMSKSYLLLCKQAPENLVKWFRFGVCERAYVCLSLFLSKVFVSWLAFLSLQIKITRTHHIDNCIVSYQWQSNVRIRLRCLCIA